MSSGRLIAAPLLCISLVGVLALHCAAQAPASASAVPASAASETPVERIQNATRLTSLDTPGLQPWHLKVSFQLFDAKGKPTETGTMDEWWAGPKKDRVTFSSPSYTATTIANEDGLFRTPDKDFASYTLQSLHDRIVHPGPSVEAVDQSSVELQARALGKVHVECVVLSQHPENQKTVFVGVFPTYCLQAGTDTLLATYGLGQTSGIRRRIGTFQGIQVPIELDVANNAIMTFSSKIEELGALADGQDALFQPVAETKVNVDDPMKVPGSVIASHRIKGPLPEYPQMARERHMTGSVVLHVIVGADGHVQSLTPQSSPDPSLTLEATRVVRQYIYTPFLLGGEPISVDTTVTVNFAMD